ncbi:MAG: RNA methyltransferase [Actinomycetota bacterium]|nr:RNA methyltransferase [Actinomycetota bacterium]
MPVIDITDPADPRVADYLCLTDVDLRTKLEPPQGLFIAEGELVIRRAVRAGYAPRSVLVSPAWLRSLPALDLPADTPVYLAGAGVLEAITGFRVHRGALASVHRRPLPSAEELLAVSRRVAVLEDVNTHTNVGAIFRCAAALGMDAVLLSPSCADPLYRRSVRVSMGEVFAVPYARLATWPADLDLLGTAGFRLLALTPDPAALALDEVRLTATDRAALLLGAEGPGLSPAAMGRVEQAVRIPMSAGVDSLNVAAAAAVAFYVLGRRPR